nr:MAG TPA: hypothetical protein [Caudoviricetes sp.]
MTTGSSSELLEGGLTTRVPSGLVKNSLTGL